MYDKILFAHFYQFGMIGKMVPLHPNVDVCLNLQRHQLLILKSASVKYLEFSFNYLFIY